MTEFPLAQTIGHRVYDATARDSHGNSVDAWADPVDVQVYGWHTGSSDEPRVVGHDRVVVQGQVLAPESFRPSPRDLVDLPGAGTYEVIGEPEDYNHGPFDWRPGVVVNLRRATG